jgi:hypothetical protein
MSAHSSLDRKSFQTLLANGFAVQESGMDTRLLSAIVEVQRSIATGEADADRAMHLIAELALNVGNAAGIAIALVKADQLVYRAGSGSAACYVGRHVPAVLNTSTHNESEQGEILRVENAQTDARIEAAICRQFGAMSLLILPIYQGHAVAGVLEILFNEAHTFQNREVRTYRLLVTLIKDSIFRDSRLVRKEALPTQHTTVPYAIKQITSQMQKVRGDDKDSSGPPCMPSRGLVRGAVAKLVGRLPGLFPPPTAATTLNQYVKRAFFDKFRLNLAAAGVVFVLLVTSWVAYEHRRASPVDGPALRRSNAAWQQPTPILGKPLPTNHPFTQKIARSGTENTNAANSALKRVRVRQNEDDYIADDVTIRHFTPKPAPSQVQTWNKQVTVGEDVTVRYFATRSANGSPTWPVSSEAPNR